VPDLSDPALAADVAALAHCSRLSVLDRTGSTNADLLADVAAPVGAVLVAREQTAGRGRLDRRWEASPGALTFSVLLAPSVPLSSWGWLPLLAGLAVHDALALGGVAVRLKWPNDLLLGAGKAGGVLVQRADRETGPVAVVGIGLNLTAPPPAVAGATALGERDAGELLLAVLTAIDARLAAWEAAGGDVERSGLAPDYRRACDTLGRRVIAQRPGAPELTGTAFGIDDLGRVVIRRDAADLAAAAATGAPDCAARELAIGAGDLLHLR
jgi:BirA family biotin operon repressor/biotin-[acetyl-CoA-carboxylase] ligase